VLQSEQQLAAATARIGVAKAERFPKITLTGLLGVASPQLSSLRTAFGNANLELAGPLFNAQILGFQQQAAEAQARQAVAQYEQTILVAFGSRRCPRGGAQATRSNASTRRTSHGTAVGLAPCRSALQGGARKLSGCAHRPAEPLRRRAVAHGHPPAPPGVHRPALQGAGHQVEPAGGRE